MTQHQHDFDPLLLDVLTKMDGNGWTVMHVVPTDDDPIVPYGYTVGLTTFGHPDLAIYGLPVDVAGVFLNNAAKLVKYGRKIEDGEVLRGIVRGLAVAAIAMTETGDLPLLRAIYGNSDDVLQLVWPDRFGNFPWEDDYSGNRADQPIHGPTPTTSGV